LVAVLLDGTLSPFMRIMLQNMGSEFYTPRVIEERAQAFEPQSSNEVELIGPDGTRPWDVPEGEAVKVEEINFNFYESSAGPVTAAMQGCSLLLVTGKGNRRKPLHGIPPLRLGDWIVRNDRLHFGAIPVGVWLVPESDLRVVLAGSGAGGATQSMEFEVSLTLRREPRWLAEAAGFVQPRK
jgi:hypothetical protein